MWAGQLLVQAAMRQSFGLPGGPRTVCCLIVILVAVGLRSLHKTHFQCLVPDCRFCLCCIPGSRCERHSFHDTKANSACLPN